ncbi:Uncharacterized protein Rs2_37274 [Raphanus sativus]|nr:Uncharacterized protein Rs2_37274 [Raphanus sativus]
MTHNSPPMLARPGFKERLDRHGNPFGERVSTKQTRNPPPASKTEIGGDTRPATNNIPEEEKEPTYASPPYSRNRVHTGRQVNQRKDLFPRRSEGQWRPKLVVVPNPPEEMQNRNQISPRNITPKSPPLQLQGTNDHTLAKEAIMEELHEVTRQYFNCGDPVEAAARRQRVQYTDAEGLMETTTAAILAASMQNLPEFPHPIGDSSNPATPPPLQDPVLQAPNHPAPLILLSPSNDKDEDERLEPYYSDESPLINQWREQVTDRPTRLRSVVVSPQVEERETPPALRTPLELREDAGTFRMGQDRVTDDTKHLTWRKLKEKKHIPNEKLTCRLAIRGQPWREKEEAEGNL